MNENGLFSYLVFDCLWRNKIAINLYITRTTEYIRIDKQVDRYKVIEERSMEWFEITKK